MKFKKKYVLAYAGNQCMINKYFYKARVETNANVILADELSELDINLVPVLENVRDQELNFIYNYQGNLICEIGEEA